MTDNQELFTRKHSLTIGTLEVSDFRCKFHVEKTLRPEPNKALIEVYNLSEEHRAELGELAPGKAIKGKKKGKIAPDIVGRIPVRLEAGYEGPGTDLIFLGDLRTVDNEIDSPDWVTAISSGDGERAYRSARIAQSFGTKTPLDTVVKALVKALDLGEGNLNKVLSSLKLQGSAKVLNAGLVMSGSAARYLTDVCRSADLEWSIQDGALQFVNLGEALAGKAIELTPDTGLVGSPSVDANGILRCKSLIVPGMRCGGLVVLKAATLDGQFRTHKLTYIGDSEGAEWYCEIEGKRY